MDLIMAIIFVGLIIHGIQKNQRSQKKRAQKQSPEEKPIAYVNKEHRKDKNESRYVKKEASQSPQKARPKSAETYKKRTLKGPLQELVTALEELADAGKNVIEKEDTPGSFKDGKKVSLNEGKDFKENQRSAKNESRKHRFGSRPYKKGGATKTAEEIDIDVSKNYTPRLTTMKKSRYANRGLKIEVEDIDGDVQNKQLTALSFDGDSVIKGVIWKEILDKRVG